MTEARTVVVGVGSPLMADDGVGVVVAGRLREVLAGVPDVAVLDGGTWGMQLLPALEAADALVVVDAIHEGGAPGGVVRLEKDELPRLLYHKVSPHQIDLREVFAVMELRGTFPARAVALGVEPERVEMDDRLSPCVAAAVPRVVDAVVAQLSAWGHAVPAPAGAEPPGAPVEVPHA